MRISTLLTDLRQSWRGMRAAPGLTLVVVLTLAVGIGANGAIFSVINGVVLEPLEYPQPSELVLATSQFPTLGFDRFWISPPEYMEYREWSRSFTELGAYRAIDSSVMGLDQPMQVRSAVVTASLFGVLGVLPVRGRVFGEEEDIPDGPAVAVMGYELWQRAFGADEALVGESLDIDGEPRTILGIMPPGFDIEENGVEVWLPLGLGERDRGRRGNHLLYLVGRLRDGITLGGARAELETLLQDWRERVGEGHTPSPENHRLQLMPLHEEVVGKTRPALYALLGAVGFVLLIACANVANLLLARSEARQKEMAIRTAMGAGRLRLVRQLLTESVLLAVIGGGLGVLLAHGGLRLVLAAYPSSLPRADGVSLEATVLLFTLAVAVLTGVLFGLLPALQLSSGRLGGLLKEGGHRSSAGRAGQHVRRSLVVVEMALAVGLVVGSGLMLKSLSTLLAVEMGFQTSRRTTFELFLPSSSYPEASEQVAFFERLLSELEGVPGIEAVGAASGLPPLRSVDANDTELEGLEPTPDGPPHNLDYYQTVTDAYLDVMGIRIVEGRGFTAADDGEANGVALVNEKTARIYWPERSALGRRLRPCCGDEVPWLTIVGVVEDVKQGGLAEEVGTEVYFRYAQVATKMGFAPRTMHTVLRSELDPSALAATLRQKVWELDPSLPVAKLSSMDQVVSASVAQPRLLTLLLSIFGGLALFLASIGIYGVMSYSVAERGQEMGIRIALGADRRRILGLVLSQGMVLALVGLAVGVGTAVLLSRLLESLLFGVSPGDPPTYLGVVGLLGLVALVACFVPAFRATRVDPLRVLRYE